MNKKLALMFFLFILGILSSGFYFNRDYVWIKYKKVKPFKIGYIEKQHLLKGDKFIPIKGVIGSINNDVSICDLSFKGFSCYNGKISLIANPLSNNDEWETLIRLEKI